MGGEGAAGGASPGDEQVAAVMARLAEGDGAAIITLRERFGPELARAIRGAARHRGARLGADEVDELVTDVAVELAGLAGAWRPGGAPPWVWARGRVGEVVDRHVGQWADPLDGPVAGPRAEAAARSVPPPGAGSEPPVLDVVAALAGRHATVALLHEAVARVASPRDQVIFFEAAVQTSLGDRSPAVTVGDLFGLAPATVRQQQLRVKRRLRALAASDPRFAGLADLPVVA